MINLLTDKIVMADKQIEYWVDMEEYDDYTFKLSGWAIVVGIPSWQLDLKIDFRGSRYNFSCKPHIIQRHDVSMINGKGAINYNNAGFFIEIPKQNVGPDCYDIVFHFKKKDSNESVLQFPFVSVRIQ